MSELRAASTPGERNLDVCGGAGVCVEPDAYLKLCSLFQPVSLPRAAAGKHPACDEGIDNAQLLQEWLAERTPCKSGTLPLSGREKCLKGLGVQNQRAWEQDGFECGAL